MTAQQCAERQAARDNLVHELVAALEGLVAAVKFDLSYEEMAALDVAHAALARAREQA